MLRELVPMHSYRLFWLYLLSLVVGITTLAAPRRVIAQQQPQSQRLVESVDVTGNRRLRKDDILYWVQTRPGDVYNPEQVDRDFQAILQLGFFDKTATRVFTENGPRGGVNSNFEVKEWPVIRGLTLEGLKSLQEPHV